MTVSRLIARPMLASMFVVGGVNALKNAQTLAGRPSPVADKVVPAAQRAGIPLPDDRVTQVRLNAAVQIGAAAALATGRVPRLASAALAATLVPATVAGQPFGAGGDPEQKADRRLDFFRNVSMLGGLLLAAVDTDGKPGVAWRARRAARDVRREAKQLGRTARREARLAAAKAH